MVNMMGISAPTTTTAFTDKFLSGLAEGQRAVFSEYTPWMRIPENLFVSALILNANGL